MASIQQIATDWNFSPLFSDSSQTSFRVTREEIQQAAEIFVSRYRSDTSCLDDPHVLREALDAYEIFIRTYGNGGDEGYYYGLKSELDQSDPKIKAAMNDIDDFSVKIANDMAFFEISLTKIPHDKQKEFLASSELDPYKHFLERCFEFADHTLSEEEEKILTLKSGVSHGKWVEMTSTFLSKEEEMVTLSDGKKRKKGFNEIIGYLNDPHKIVRDSAANAFNTILHRYSDVAEAEMNAILKDKEINDELRHYEYPQSARLLSDDMDKETVDVLIEQIQSHFAIAQRYYRLKAKALGVEKLAYHERSVPYGTANLTIAFNEAVEIVYRTLNHLSTDFGDIFKEFVEGGHIDAFPKKGKWSGAFCAHGLKTQPIYLLLNYTNKLSDVLTVAHETGHGINDVLMNLSQNALNFGTPLSTAEVASTFMEDFVLQDLLKEADEETRLTLLFQKMDEDIATIFRQAAFYLFEDELHRVFREKKYLTKEDIGNIFQKHMERYMGDAVIQSPGSENWWIYVSHFRTFFYVYSYASGLLISKAMQHAVRTDPSFIEKVKVFLSAGMSASPKDIFHTMGIDITDKTFWLGGIQEMEDLLNELESLIETKRGVA